MVFLCAAPVFAAETAAEAEAGWGVWETVGRFFNLFLLFGGLIYLVRKPAGAFFEQRRQEIHRKLAEAARRLREAESKIQEIELRMNRIEEQLAEIRARSEQEILDEAHRLEELARQESEKILAVARREVDGMVKSAQKELRRYAGKLSVELAGDIIRKNIDQNDQERMLKKFVSEVEAIR
ncbi:MAG TPA: hypothetical protein VGK99_06780 [Acidobacteriota bacterium]